MKTYYMQVRIRTISFRSDDGPPPLRQELQHEPVPTKRGLLSWLWRPRIELSAPPLQIEQAIGGNYVEDAIIRRRIGTS